MPEADARKTKLSEARRKLLEKRLKGKGARQKADKPMPRRQNSEPAPLSLAQERFELWKGFATSIVASKGIRAWWDDENGKFAFMPRVRNLIDEELTNSDDSPVPFNTMWKIFMTQTWQESASAA